MSATTYLDRMLDPVAEAFTPEFARKIVDLRADPTLVAQVEMLRKKANEGQLTDQEKADYEDLVEAVDVVSIIQSKARRFLAKHES